LPRPPPASLTKGLEEREIFVWMLLGVQHLRHLTFSSIERKWRASALLQRGVYLATKRETPRTRDALVRCRTRAKAQALQRYGAACAIVLGNERAESLTRQAERRESRRRERTLPRCRSKRATLRGAKTSPGVKGSAGSVTDAGPDTSADADSRQAKHETPVLLLLWV